MARTKLMPILAAGLSGLFSPADAPAQPANRTPTNDLPTVVAMDTADCRRLLAAKARDDVTHRPEGGVAYQPGVDTRGNPVAPADLPRPAGALALPETLTLDIKIPFSTLLGDRAPSRTGSSDLGVAKLKLDLASGRITLDGTPVEAAGEDAVVAACRAHLAQPAKR